jgi:hypothetical protein
MDNIIYNGAFTSVGKQVKCRTTVLLTFNLMGTIKMKPSGHGIAGLFLSLYKYVLVHILSKMSEAACLPVHYTF